ncbi:MAG: class A beta-lactamase [Ottowia sp.]|uniref:class A beta-lactamase n=1 Tax=Ottowia sp. TaxID=1898956 RepID=UPI003C74A16B
MKRRQFFFSLGAASMVPVWAREGSGNATQQALTQAMQSIERQAGARLGVAVLDTGSGAAFQYRGAERFPMCSTFKFLLAAQALHAAEQGKGSLDTRVRYKRSALVPNSPATKPHADGAGMTVRELCAATVSLSDNTAANLLLARLGGPAGFTRYMRGLGDTVTRLDRIEPAMSESKPGDVRDTTTPQAMLSSMQKVTLGNAVSPASRRELLAWLLDCKTGDHTLRAGAPGWKVANKTGAGPGTRNDVGLLWRPGTQAAPLLITSFLTESQAPMEGRDPVLASVAREVVKQLE